MIAAFVSILLSLPFLYGAPEEQEKNYLKIYNLSKFMYPELNKPNMESPFTLLPFNPAVAGGYLQGNVHQLASVQSPELADFIYASIGEEVFQRAGVGISQTGRDLVVSGPESIHQKTESILDFLEQWLNRHVDVTLEVYAVESAAELPSATLEAVRAAANEGRIEAIRKSRHSIRLGELKEFSDEIIIPVVWDYEPELAQNSSVSEAVVTRMATGLKMALRPFLAADGRNLFITIFIRNSGLIDTLSTRDARYRSRVARENMVEDVEMNQSFDDPRIELSGFASLISAEPGKPVVARIGFPHHRGFAGLVFILTARVDEAPDHLMIEENVKLTAWNFAYLQANNRLDFYKSEKYKLPVIDSKYEEVESSILYLGPPGESASGSVVKIIDVLQGVLDEEYSSVTYDEDIGRDLMSLGNHVFLRSSPGVHTDLHEKIRQFIHWDSHPVPVELTFVEADGPSILNDPAEILSKGVFQGVMSMPLMNGGKATFVSGFGGLMIHDYDVDVATGISVPNPNMRSFLDGSRAFLWHEPAVRPGSGKDEIRVKVCVNRLIPPITSRNLGDRGGILGIIDQPRFERTLVDTRFARDGRPHFLGSLSSEKEGKPVTLYILGQAR